MADGYTELNVADLQTSAGVRELMRMLRQVYDNVSGDAENVRTFYGVGSPESVISAGIGSVYFRTDGSTNTTLYRKESGTGNTGWVAVTNVSLPLSIANGGTNITTYTLGDILYSSATDVLAKLAGNTTTTKKYLTQTGNGSVSAAPVWEALPAQDHVCFIFHGAGTQASYRTGTTQLASAPTGNYASWFTTSTSLTQILESKFKKLSGLNTLTVYAYVGSSNGASSTVTVQAVISTANGSTTRNAAGVGWVNFTVDVSGLSNGTIYDLVINLKDSEGTPHTAHLFSAIGFISA